MVRGVPVGEQILLMTRPWGVSQSFVARLCSAALQDTQVIYAPLIDIVPCGMPPLLARYAGVIFTSANGVEAAPVAVDAGMPAYCVGRRTARRARAAGFRVQITAQDADDLVARIADLSPQGRLAHLSGRHTRGDIAARLGAAGIAVDARVVYDQQLRPLTAQALRALSGEVPVILPLFSPRTAAHLVSHVKEAPHTRIIALSGAVRDALGQARFAQVQIAAYPSGKDMVASIEKVLRGSRLS